MRNLRHVLALAVFVVLAVVASGCSDPSADGSSDAIDPSRVSLRDTVTDVCPGSVSLAQAIAIAEGQVAGGTAIAAIPDDDVACAREIQVRAASLLWEVKVAGDGSVLELEESDETED